jgi:hypothetical protein
VTIGYGAGDDRANRLDSRFDSVDNLISASNDHFLIHLPLKSGKHVIRGITGWRSHFLYKVMRTRRRSQRMQ